MIIIITLIIIYVLTSLKKAKVLITYSVCVRMSSLMTDDWPQVFFISRVSLKAATSLELNVMNFLKR